MPLRAHTPAWPSTRSAEARAVAAMRLVLAAAALLVALVARPQDEAHASALYALLSAYVVYGVVLYARRLATALDAGAPRWTHWIDLGWTLGLTGLSGGASSPFFALFFFPILVASFRWGFGSGMATTAVAAAGSTAVGLAVGGLEAGFELDRFLLRPVFLLVLGFAISSRGGFERLLQQRLALLKEIGRLSNPRLGADRTIGASLERLRAFYDADDCLLLLADGDPPAARLRRATREDPERGRREDPLPPPLAEQLLALPADHALVVAGDGWRPPWRAPAQQYDVARGAPTPVDAEIVKRLAAWFAPASFLTVPVLGRGGTLGRLYLACSGLRLRPGDVDFLLQVVDCLLPLLENIHLVDRLAAGAADEERQKIARDVHDSIIQPYVGMQIGLTALQQQAATALAPGAPAEPMTALAGLAHQIDRLASLSDRGLEDLRRFILRLKTGRGGEESGFATIVASYARRFADLTGIAVETEIGAVPELDANDRLAAEVFQMIAEGLSNVRRHGGGKRALVRLAQSEVALTVVVQNDGDRDRPPAPFTPRSIADRAQSLAGWTQVDVLPDGTTRVTVAIPL